MKAFRLSIVLGVALSAQFVPGLGTGPLYAGSINSGQLPTVSVKIEDSPTAPTWTHTPAATQYRPSPDGKPGYDLVTPSDHDILNNRAHVRIEEIQFDPDPFVLSNILVTNTTTSTQIFSAFVGLPTTFAAPNLISGNVQTGVIDGGTDGATIATVSPTAIYQAQIDGVTVATLQNHPFSVTALAGSSNSASASFGPTVSAVPVTSNIGIQLRFSLSPGDTASILSRFDVVVPEPTSAAIIGIGLALVTRRRRRG